MDMCDSLFGAIPSTLAFPPSDTMHEIHVLLVDGDDNETILNMLESFSYKVTAVKFASIALSTLIKETTRFDIVIADMKSCHSYMFQLLKQCSKMQLFTIVLCGQDNLATSLWALEHGAFLCIKKPVSMEFVGCLWQHVVRDKLSKIKEREKFIDNLELNALQRELHNEAREGMENGINATENPNAKQNSKTPQHENAMVMKRKVWTEWTEELHEKFMEAVAQLGEGRCYPKEILELMNVPGLTRMQVASHLQKCRNAKWLPPHKRRSKLAQLEKMVQMRSKTPRSKTQRFGSMPRLDYDSELHLEIQENPANNQEFAMDLPMITNNAGVGDNNQGGLDNSYYPQLLLDQANYPFAENNDPFMMVPPANGFGLDEAFMYDVQSINSSANSSTNQIDVVKDAFEFSCMDSMVQTLLPSPLEFGMDYNGNFQPPAQDQLLYQMPFGPTDAGANNWVEDGQIE